MSGSSVTLLDVINGVREAEGKAPLMVPSYRRVLPPRLPVRAVPTVEKPQGDLHACTGCGRPVFETTIGSLYDDRTLWHLHECEAPAAAVTAPPLPAPSAPPQRSITPASTPAPRRFTGGVAI